MRKKLKNSQNKRKRKLKLRTRHMPTKVHEKEDIKVYRRKKKHKKKVEDE